VIYIIRRGEKKGLKENSWGGGGGRLKNTGIKVRRGYMARTYGKRGTPVGGPIVKEAPVVKRRNKKLQPKLQASGKFTCAYFNLLPERKKKRLHKTRGQSFEFLVGRNGEGEMGWEEKTGRKKEVECNRERTGFCAQVWGGRNGLLLGGTEYWDKT